MNKMKINLFNIFFLVLNKIVDEIFNIDCEYLVFSELFLFYYFKFIYVENKNFL